MSRIWRMRSLIAAAAFALAASAPAAPPLTLIQDTLYKADGTRFDGIAQIEWKSFQAGDGSEVPQQIVTVRIAGGYLRVQLVPTTDTATNAYYTVRFNADGRTQFVEYWSVPPTSAILRLKDVRRPAPTSGPISAPNTAIGISDIAGLRTELDLRPARGANYVASRAAIIGATGAIESATGLPGDCVRVNGTAGPCGTGGGQLQYVDAETPQGAVNGTNLNFTLTGTPAPAGSLRLYKNGLLLRQGVEYTVSGNAVTLTTAAVPSPGDSLQAWYRLAATGTPAMSFVDGETPFGTIDGANTIFKLSMVPLPATSLQIYRNGVLQKAGIDYTLSVDTITFFSVSIPQQGDLLQAWYRN